MALCLSIETTGRHLGLALHEYDEAWNTRCQGRYFKEIPGQQSEELFPRLSRLMAKLKYTPKDLTLIGVDTGPGSFTGVRVGVTAARTLAQGLGIPVVGISRLEALAHQASWKEMNFADRVLSCMPALTGEVYYAVYRRNKSVLEADVLPTWGTMHGLSRWISRFSKKKAGRLKMVGDQIQNLEEHFSKNPVIEMEGSSFNAHPCLLGDLAIGQIRRKNGRRKFDYSRLAPLYLQPSWAERDR